MKRVITLRVEARRLDSSAALLLRSLFESAWEAKATTVVLDLCEVVSIDSLGIAALIAEHRRRPPGARIALCAPSDYVREVLDVTQLFRVFDIFPDAEGAKAALMAAPTSAMPPAGLDAKAQGAAPDLSLAGLDLALVSLEPALVSLDLALVSLEPALVSLESRLGEP